MLDKSFLISHFSFLINKKNLLAFSAGIDSSALFFLLVENHIPFDIALVNYSTRKNSDKEEAHAKALATKYGLRCHTIKAPKFDTHFEQHARTFRYGFFEKLIEEHRYDTLLTAHQLNDQLEWLLMRLGKGAGLCELLGLESIVQKEGYTMVRPLLAYAKDELLNYLETHHYPYFIDESNLDERFERNRFRKQFSDPLIAEFQEGIKRSFAYLKDDKHILEEGFETLYRQDKLRIIKLHHSWAKAKAADIALKELGYLLSAAQRKEIEKESSLVIGGEWAVELHNNLLFISPYSTTDMPKKFKEACRLAKIPAKIRAYLFEANINPSSIIPHS
ncbi:MAG: tRNA lysidine(34) synthetase TilS [Campylobacterales bacterium]|nr:tRNA lysidine(34) synthetase TilS [Campylobacterales bacterium]